MSSIIIHSDTDDDSRTIQSTPSTPSTSRRKRITNAGGSNRSNKSHTSFFFRTDEISSDIVYCKICEQNLIGTNQKPYPYTRKGGSTSNMMIHLRDKHGIIKDNYTEYLDNNREVWYY